MCFWYLIDTITNSKKFSSKKCFSQRAALVHEAEMNYRHSRENGPFHPATSSDGGVFLGQGGDPHGRAGGTGQAYHGLLSNETPFDSGLARGVKRTYVCLDRISGRIGTVLRRNPLARIFSLTYMVR